MAATHKPVKVHIPSGKPFKYSAIEEDEIRLFKLHCVPSGGDWSSELCGELLTFILDGDYDGALEEGLPQASSEANDVGNPLKKGTIDPPRREKEEAPEYDALSYVWGGEDPEGKDGQEFGHLRLVNSGGASSGTADEPYLIVTANLEDALRRFRKNMKTLGEAHIYLWADAICINQKNTTERSAQIRKMATIYSCAETVRVWLGKEDNKSAFDFIRRILSLEDFDDIVHDPVTVSEWNTFRDLMQNSWFKRRWIVQEIAFARTVEVYCGRYSVPWREVASAMTLFASKSTELRQMFQKAPGYAHPDYLGEIDGYGAKTLVDTIGRMFRKSEDGEVMDHLLSLESLITTLTPFDAKLPHDCVYAIMRLSNDARPGSHKSMSKQTISKPWAPMLQKGDVVSNTASAQKHHGAISNSPDRINGSKESTRPTTPEGTRPPTPDETIKQNESEGQRGRTLTVDHNHSLLHVPGTKSARSKSRSRSRSPGAAMRRAEQEHRKLTRPFLVDYKKSMYKLCTDVINFAAEQSKSIDMICQPWVPDIQPSNSDGKRKIHPDDTKKLPSWLQSLQERPYGVSTDARRYSRYNANPLVGTFLSGLKSYNASGRKPIPEEFLPPNGSLISGRLLSARGFILDVVQRTTESANDAVIPSDWLEFGSWDDLKKEPPERFWRTLVANRESSDGPQRPPDYWQYACRWAFARKAAKGNLNIKELVMNIWGKPSTPVIAFLDRVRAVIWNRKLIESKGWEEDEDDHKLTGLAPKEAQPGDKICILYGCSVPVLLRPKIKPKTPRKSMRNQSERSKTSRRHTRGPSRTISQPVSPHPAAAVPEVSITGEYGEQVETVQSNESTNTTVGTPLPVQKNSTNQAEIYTLVGACYIHGMMEGEAFAQKERRKLVEENFQIGCVANCNCDACT